MADTRLKAVATAESLRTLSAGIGRSATADAVGDLQGHSISGHTGLGHASSGVPAVTACCAQRLPGLSHPFFAHTSPPQRPTSVRAGVALRSGAPRQSQLLRTGLPCCNPVLALGAPWKDRQRARVAYAPGKVPMGADRDPSIVEAC